jgi:hypothetical protein
MTMTKSQAIKVTGVIREVRPDWDAPGIMAALAKLADKPFHESVIAMLTAAADEGAHTPMAGVTNPLYWPNWGKAQAVTAPHRDPAYLRFREECAERERVAAKPRQIAAIRRQYGESREVTA